MQISPVLITCTLPKKNKKLSSHTHQTKHVQSVSTLLSGARRETLEGEDQRR
ncbi:unnamed protein product [Staurois parvus]|uniref:Uncharacterized protein n=1 Tax=Staurois parvus TaxID=386267 RepID=A0ABN9HML7_9NEOB|nr:unnamed protein product [Staurois parvus]